MQGRQQEFKSTLQSALPKTTGQAEYVLDISVPNCLEGYVVRSPVPHAIIHNIDVTEASKVPGVKAVVIAKDIPGVNRLGKTKFDQPIIADDKVRSYIDAVALIAAENREAAKEAERKIVMELEPVSAVFSIDEAIVLGAPVIHADSPDNILTEVHLEKGDIASGFDQAEVIIEDSYKTPSIEHSYFEPDNGVIVPQEGGHFTIWVGCHSVYAEKQIASKVLSISEDKVTVIQPYTGGSFGGKDDGLLTAYLALLANKSGMPVRISFSRKELFVSHTKRHPQWITIRMGFRKDGTITAVHIQIQTDTGAYAHWAEGIFNFASIGASGPYNIPNIKVDTRVIYTNNVPMGAMRGWGMPGVTFAMESHLDQAARSLSIHPLTLRWRNAAKEGDLMVTESPFPEGIHIMETIQAAADRFDVKLLEQAR
jgi:nicotinate dehydrogenase large molybdopterin subunit